MRRALTWTIALLVAALAGCAEEEPVLDDSGDHDDHDHSGHDHGNATMELEALLEADVLNGTAPLLVNFTIDAQGANATWSLDFGDGNSTEGDALPAQANHTFAANATVTLTITAGNQTAMATQGIVVAAVEAVEQAVPEKTRFEFGESLGCAGDLLAEVGEHCLSAAHPDDSGIDGFWIELGPAYVGWDLTTTVDNTLGDSDCDFLDESLSVIGNGNNGLGPCVATVPEGAAWLFLYSYAEPALGQTAEFTLD